MAKKAKTEVPVVEAAVETSTVSQKAVAKKDDTPKWEIRDRLYTLKSNKRPLIFTIPAKHTAKTALLFFDPAVGYQREIRYATNQRSVFVDEQEGIATLGRIVLRDGAITVPKENQALQMLLSLYHPYRNEVYEEFNPVQRANNEVNWIEHELKAMNLAKSLSLDEAEAILRVEFGSKVNKYSSNELKRDVLVFARKNPVLFLELANDDNVHLRNFGIKATEAKLLKLSPDQRTFTYGDGDRKLMIVPFDEHPYSALASFFKTDEGLEVYKALQKRMQ